MTFFSIVSDRKPQGDLPEDLEFISDDGYTSSEFWLSEGWDHVKREAWQGPLYWRRDVDEATGWRVFTLRGWHGLSELLETPAPCSTSSFFKVDAFARRERTTGFRPKRSGELSRAKQPRQGNLLETGRFHPTAAMECSVLGSCSAIAGNGPRVPTPGYPQ